MPGKPRKACLFEELGKCDCPDAPPYVTATVLAGDDRGTVRLMRVENGEEIRQFAAGDCSVGSLAFSPDGLRFLSGDTLGKMCLWERNTGEQRGSFDVGSYVMGVAFSPSGRHGYCVSWDGTLQAWDLGSAAPIARAELCNAKLWCLATHFQGAEELALAGGDDGIPHLIDLRTCTEVAALSRHASSIGAIAFSSDGRWAATGDGDRNVRVWDVAMRREICRATVPGTRGISGLAFLPKNRQLLTCSDTLRVWRLTTLA